MGQKVIIRFWWE